MDRYRNCRTDIDPTFSNNEFRQYRFRHRPRWFCNNDAYLWMNTYEYHFNVINPTFLLIHFVLAVSWPWLTIVLEINCTSVYFFSVFAHVHVKSLRFFRVGNNSMQSPMAWQKEYKRLRNYKNNGIIELWGQRANQNNAWRT